MSNAARKMARARARAIDWSGMRKLYAEMAATSGDELLALIRTRYPDELKRLRQQARLTPVAVDGSRTLGRQHGYFETRLPDGTIGYYQRRADDCLQAAIATLVQIPMPEVCDFRIDEQQAAGKTADEIEQANDQQLAEWLDAHGLVVTHHPGPPESAARWMGILPGPREFTGHCLIFTGPTLLWDPTYKVPPQLGDTPSTYTPGDVQSGVTINRRR